MKLKELKNKIIPILREAGKIALSLQNNLSSEIKLDNTLVTNGDLAVNDFLFDKFKEFSNNILSEEEYDIANLNDKDYIFLIDPIDGTVSYDKGNNTWAILLAVLDPITKDVLLSFVYQVAVDKLYYAIKDEGSFLIHNNEILSLTIDHSATEAILSPSEPEKEKEFVKNNNLKYFTRPSAALKVMAIVDNEALIYPNFSHKASIWDFLPAELILSEAGGEIVYEKPWSIESPRLDQRVIAKVKDEN